MASSQHFGYRTEGFEENRITTFMRSEVPKLCVGVYIQHSRSPETRREALLSRGKCVIVIFGIIFRTSCLRAEDSGDVFPLGRIFNCFLHFYSWTILINVRK